MCWHFCSSMIYISFCSSYSLGQELPFSLSKHSLRKERSCITSISRTPLLLTGALASLVGWSFSRPENTWSVFSTGWCSTGGTSLSKDVSLSARTTACLAAKGAHRKSLAELAQPGWDAWRVSWVEIHPIPVWASSAGYFLWFNLSYPNLFYFDAFVAQ